LAKDRRPGRLIFEERTGDVILWFYNSARPIFLVVATFKPHGCFVVPLAGGVVVRAAGKFEPDFWSLVWQ